MTKPGEYYVKPFEELKTSTSTVMCYSNVLFNRFEMFRSIPITIVNPALTKKKKNIDKKKLTADYGAIISLQYYPPKEDKSGIYFRGVRMSKRKTYWCPVCQLYSADRDGSMQKVLTVHEHHCDVSTEHLGTHVTIKELNLYPPDTKKILFKCSNCDRYIEFKNLGKIVPFLNQLTIVMSLEGIMVNIMLFNSKFKIAGNKTFADAVQTTMLLWEDYTMPNRKLWSIYDSTMDAKFLFSTVMFNVDFSMGFSIDKIKLNTFMQNERASGKIYISQYEPTSTTHVNIKIVSDKPDEFSFYVLVYKNTLSTTKVKHKPYFETLKHNPYDVKKPKEDKYTTFIVFSSSQIILTGRYLVNMKRDYEFVVNLINANRDKVSEVVEKPKISIVEYLKLLEKEKLLKLGAESERPKNMMQAT